ncbi:magnesium transporter [Marinimicrobium sp. ABcell2]|uniref:magnesium transporter n=1 Tax=Marinimicrobium sp. ABcell2 TaxID=3069751 RepID=UPI0027B5C8B8|nr:magnesium transporter [Marinimicrobium sp. ABcell2]MDQ2075867.1 magnesium transporter [Marinimicrobium sp. ABcell2]
MEQTDSALMRDLIQHETWSEVATHAENMHVQDIAAALDGLEPDVVARALEELPKESWPDIVSYLSLNCQNLLLQQLDDESGRLIMSDLSPDDRTTLLEALPADQVEQLLKLLSPGELKHALQQLGYPEDSAGRLMTTGFITLREYWTLGTAIAHLRRHRDDQETINTLYITDHKGRLQGTISLKRLVLEDPDRKVEELVSGEPVSIFASEDRTEAVRLIQHYDITALPVVDANGALLGVVTVDDVMDVAEEENTEDFHKIGGMGAVGLSLRDASPALLYRKRIGWLVLLVFMNLFGGASIAHFEATIEAVIALVFFLPLIVASGGNAGAQAATLMVRALATGDVHARDWLKLWGKELSVSLALGLTMGAAIWGIGLWRGGYDVALVVSLSTLLVVVIGSMIGMLLPFVLNRFNMDPATASAPLITTIADICGILIYLSIATAILQIGVI